ncbi:flagellar hook-basal body complex protein [Thermanaeromonas sp. C210]|uniref:flagellar hook-basal body complex protein n=1 Tax=Thermanaeromonas sp. C210 TaxID=2731925 RepID=UPI00155D3013|nr:flagellar hook-basal body complex protein [Thermanaeromonas sp. C210]GFN24144.1 flagellar basal body protein [Thermanaeromonas sp. C210]
MMRSLFSAVAGLRTHQTRMDVIGDNIANVNTVGFKRSAVTFKDVFYQTLRGGSAGTGDIGGTNPQQVGLGVTLASIDVVHTQGAAQPTGNGTDLMIQGDGFFVVEDGSGNEYYTRAGAFHFAPDENDANNVYLVNPDGFYVVDENGYPISIPTNALSYTIDRTGTVKYIDPTNGQLTDAGTIKLAKFANPAGLEKVGSNLYVTSAAAGDVQEGTAGTGDFANTIIIPSALEMSNVELAQEFSDMIVTQRGFQANARVITASDEMLQELVNLKR